MKDKDRLYLQTAAYMEERIERGDWAVHEKLPSVRELSRELGCHRLTVFRAYQELKERGKVYVKDKSGYYVHPAEPMAEPAAEAWNPGYKARNRLSEIHRIPARFPFSEAVVDPNLMPNLYFSEYVKKVFDLYPKVLASYSHVQGDEELRNALSLYLSRRHRMLLTPGEILITTGAQQAIDLLSRVLVRPMDTVLMERPTYSSAVDIFTQQGARIVTVDIGPGGYRMEQVEWCMAHYRPRLFYMNPTFHNPTGYTVPEDQRKQLVELAERYRCLLVDDDTCYDIYFGSRKPPKPLFAYDTEGMVVYIRGFSKYVSPGLRIASVVCREPLMSQLLTAKSLTDNGTPLLNQKIFLHYFGSDRLQQHLEKLRTALALRKYAMEQELAEAPGWEWTSPQGGFNLWVKLPEGHSSENLLEKAKEQGITFVPGRLCDPAREMDNRLRLCYSLANEDTIREGMKRLIPLVRPSGEKS